MAVSLAQYVDLLVKKLYGVAKTDDAANKSPSNESIPSPPLLRGDIVWTQSDQIGNTAQVIAGITQSYLGTSTIQCSPDITSVPIGGIYPTWLTGLTDWIPQEFGSTWPVKVYVDTTGAANAQATGTQIFSPGIGGTGEFFFDTQAGLLNFIGETIPASLTAGKSIFIAGYRYVGLLGTKNLPGNTTIGNLVIANTTITTNLTDGNIIISATGNGYAQIAGSAGIAIPYGNTNQRPHTPLEGTIRYNSVDLNVEVYTGNAWAAVGSGSGNNTYNISSQTISSADGSTATFTLDQVTETENILVSINGIGQSPTLNYTVAADQITFAEAPQVSDIIEIRFISPAPAAGTVTSGTQYHIPYYANTGSTVSDSGGNLNWNGTNLLTVGGSITATGNISGNYILGNGSQLTGLPVTYSNSNVSSFMAAFGSNTISTTGNICAGNVITSGALQGGTGTQGIALRPWTGGGSYAALYSTAITPADGNYSILVNGTNTWLNAAASGSLFFRINNNVSPTAFTINASQATLGAIGTANSTAYSTQTLAIAGGGLGVIGNSYFSNTVGVGGNLTVTGGVVKSSRLISTATSLTVADAGGFIEFGGSSPFTITLPNPTQAANNGIGYRFWQNTSQNITLSTPAGNFYGPSGSSTSTKVLVQATTQYWDVWSDGYNWAVFGIKTV